MNLLPTQLNLPPVWENDWPKALANAEKGTDRRIVVTQRRTAHVLKNIPDRAFSFERLAWLTLWEKGYWILDGASSGLRGRSEYILHVLSRVTFDLWLHATTIAERDHISRLRAYSAWCIWNDIHFQRELLHPKTLDGVWSPDPARGILEDKELREQYEKIFGPINVETDDKVLKRERFRQQDKEQHRRHRLERWLDHPDLRDWKKKIEELVRTRNTQIPFFSLFDESHGSVAKRLKSMGLRFLYLSYIKGSMFVHGSTVEHVMNYSGDQVAPRFLDDSEKCESLAGGVEGGCAGVVLVLNLLKRKLWPELRRPNTG